MWVLACTGIASRLASTGGTHCNVGAGLRRYRQQAGFHRGYALQCGCWLAPVSPAGWLPQGVRIAMWVLACAGIASRLAPTGGTHCSVGAGLHRYRQQAGSHRGYALQCGCWLAPVSPAGWLPQGVRIVVWVLACTGIASRLASTVGTLSNVGASLLAMRPNPATHTLQTETKMPRSLDRGICMQFITCS